MRRAYACCGVLITCLSAALAWPPEGTRTLNPVDNTCATYVMAGYSGAGSGGDSDDDSDDFFSVAIVSFDNEYVHFDAWGESTVEHDEYVHAVTALADVFGTASTGVTASASPAAASAINEATPGEGEGNVSFCSLYLLGEATLNATNGGCMFSASVRGPGALLTLYLGGMSPGVFGSITNNQGQPVVIDEPDATGYGPVYSFDFYGELYQSASAGGNVWWYQGNASVFALATCTMAMTNDPN